MKNNQSTYLKVDSNLFENKSTRLYPLLNSIYELSNDAIIVCDMSQQLIVYANNQFSEIFNYTKEQVLNNASVMINLFADESELFNVHDRLQEFDSIKDCQVVLNTKENNKLNILLTGKSQMILDKKYVVYVLKDTTDKKKIEMVLKNHQVYLGKMVEEKTTELKNSELDLKQDLDSEKMYADIFRNAPIGIVKGNYKGGYQYPNQAFADIVGYTLDELKEINWKETISTSYWVEKEEAFISELSPANNSITYEKEYVRKDGSVIPVEKTVKAIFKDNVPVSYIAFIKSIENKELYNQTLKDNEALVDGYFYASSTPIALIKDGILYEANKASCELFKYDTSEEIIGKSVLEVVAPSGHAEISRYIELRKNGEKVPECFETVGLAKDKSTFPIEVNLIVIEQKGVKYSCAFFKDLTADKLLKEKNIEGTKIFKQLVENAVTGVSITNVNGEVVYVNKTFANICGYETSGKLLSKSILSSGANICGWRNKADHDNMLLILKEKGEINNYNLDLIDKDGGIRHVLYSAKLSNDLIYGMFMDITKEKTRDILIENNEKRYRILYDNALVALLTTDLNKGTIIESNNAAVNMFGYDSIKDFKENFNNRHHFVEPNRETFLKKIEMSSYIETLHLRCLKKNGENIWVDAELKLNKETGIVNWVLVDVSDKINQRIQNRRLLKAINQSPESIAITNNIGVIEYVNRKFCELTGYSEEELVGNNPRILKSGFQNKEFYNDLWSTIKSGKIWKGEIYNKKKNGDFFWEHASIAPIFEGDEITHFVAIKEDVTEKKQMISDLFQAKEKAEESDKLKTAFLTNISHEIRTPMNGILGFTGLLKDNNLTGEEQHQYIELIEESGGRMLRTIHDIIDMSRIEAGEVDFNFSEINLTTHLKHLYYVFNDEVEKKGIELCCENKEDVAELIINSDKRKLNFIFTSLIKNAIKYTKAGRIDFGCTLVSEEKQDFLRFHVRDSGIGIPPDKLDLIFERFMQGDIRINRSYDGSGLGLSIAKSYTEMLDGKIWVKSEEGKGSAFYVSIPIEHSGKSIDKLDVVYSNVKEETMSKQLKILIVDDGVLERKYLGLVLEDVNHEVLYAETGKEGVEMFKTNPDIDMVLMDVRMPKMNGFEATGIIRELSKDVQIVMQSSFVEFGENDDAIKAGANYFITKPIDKNKLTTIIDEVYKKKNLKY